MLQLRTQFLENCGRLLQRFGAAHQAAQAFDLVAQRLLISGQFTGEAGRLRYHKTAQTEYDRESDEDDYQHRSGAGNSPGTQTHDERRQDEAQENRERDRNEDLATEIKRSDNQGGDGHIYQRRSPRLCELYLSGFLQLRTSFSQ